VARELEAAAAVDAAVASAALPPGVGGRYGSGAATREEVVVRGGHRYRRTWRRVKLVDWALARSGRHAPA